jgi:L-asparaginase II
VHRIHGAVVRPSGALVAWVGDPERPIFTRSAAKPFQALPLVDSGAADALGVPSEELAVMVGSHGGEPEHVAVVKSLLKRGGWTPEALACGAHAPMHGASARALVRAGLPSERIHNNCSGKHAGMLALARHEGWPGEGYHRNGHPVQASMARSLAQWTGVPEATMGRGVDGCGVVCFETPLRGLARGYAALLAAAREGAPAPQRVVEAMVRHPQLIAGTGRLCTRLLRGGGGRILAKVGAEGVYGAAMVLPGLAGKEAPEVLGVALKVEDGALRAAEVALLAIVRALGGLEGISSEAKEELLPLFAPIVPNTLGEPVAVLEPRFALQWGKDGEIGHG